MNLPRDDPVAIELGGNQHVDQLDRVQQSGEQQHDDRRPDRLFRQYTGSATIRWPIHTTEVTREKENTTQGSP
ncbi:hypothetical protein GCM10027563_18310 [Parasphingorhabdus pacifica]